MINKLNRWRIKKAIRNSLDSIHGNRALAYKKRHNWKRWARNSLWMYLERKIMCHKRNNFKRKQRSCEKFVPGITNNGRKEIRLNRRNFWLLSLWKWRRTLSSLYSDGTLWSFSNKSHGLWTKSTYGLVKVRHFYRNSKCFNRSSLR